MPEAKKSRFPKVGLRGWVLCLTFGGLLCATIVGQQTQGYADAADEYQSEQARLDEARAQQTQFRNQEVLSRRDQSWVMED